MEGGETTTDDRYPLVSARNLPAYAGILAIWAGVSVLLALVLGAATEGSVSFGLSLVFSGAGVLLGMAIMFGASAVNLRRLRPGFARLAEGSKDPAIPRVWCPVPTMAIRSAVEPSEKVRPGKARSIDG